ncbi:MAG: SIR2 family protein [Magnetococcales bacterium]|nr:SIR2 family protein [Magnetococcales bacterium]
MDNDTIAKLAQACYSSNPAIILGSGASMPHGLPSMGQLQKHLTDNIIPDKGAEAKAWTSVSDALASGDHLEKAMEDQNLPQELIRKIVEETWKCVNKADHEVFLKSIANDVNFPLGKLLKGLLGTSNQRINIITPNYDRVAEYVCNVHELPYSTGFMPGYIQWLADNNSITYQSNGKSVQMIRIWKVHGSLDWFAIAENVFSAPVFDIPTNARPVIVTPGLRKYEETHYEPFRSIMAGADDVLKKATGFICIGFGFRDKHIVPKLHQRCKDMTVPVAVIARTLTDEAKQFLRNNAGRRYIGLEMANTGTRIFTDTTPDGIELDKPDLWSLKGFLTLVM